MFNWDLLVFLWLLVAGFFTGFGWALGVWVFGLIFARNKG